MDSMHFRWFECRFWVLTNNIYKIKPNIYVQVIGVEIMIAGFKSDRCCFLETKDCEAPNLVLLRHLTSTIAVESSS